jgi:hypothetical protein
MDSDELMIKTIWTYLDNNREEILNNTEIINLYIDQLEYIDRFLTLEEDTPENRLLGCLLLTLVTYFKMNNYKFTLRLSIEKEI